VTARPVPPVAPDTGIPDLVRRLADDSKRLAMDEVRLARLEMATSIHDSGRGAIWLGIAFGTGVVAAVALTIALISIIGHAISDHYWAGAVIVGAIELVGALVLIRRGVGRVREPSLTLDESRESLRETVDWARTARVH
jgi:hypothetical protein